MVGCIQCGECCKKHGMRLEATPLDIARWTYDRRQDILSLVGIERDGSEILGGTLWVGPDGRRVAECPFIELRADGKYYCGIQETKPEACTAHWCLKYLEST
jgi:Fe-S-cluster containining protein